MPISGARAAWWGERERSWAWEPAFSRAVNGGLSSGSRAWTGAQPRCRASQVRAPTTSGPVSPSHCFFWLYQNTAGLRLSEELLSWQRPPWLVILNYALRRCPRIRRAHTCKFISSPNAPRTALPAFMFGDKKTRMWVNRIIATVLLSHTSHNLHAFLTGLVAFKVT